MKKDNENHQVKIERSYFVLLVLALLIGSFFIAQIRLESFVLGYKIAALEKEKQKLQENLKRLKTQTSKLESYPELIKRNQELQLELIAPEDWLELKKVRH